MAKPTLEEILKNNDLISQLDPSWVRAQVDLFPYDQNWRSILGQVSTGTEKDKADRKVALYSQRIIIPGASDSVVRTTASDQFYIDQVSLDDTYVNTTVSSKEESTKETWTTPQLEEKGIKAPQDAPDVKLTENSISESSVDNATKAAAGSSWIDRFVHMYEGKNPNTKDNKIASRDNNNPQVNTDKPSDKVVYSERVIIPDNAQKASSSLESNPSVDPMLMAFKNTTEETEGTEKKVQKKDKVTVEKKVKAKKEGKKKRKKKKKKKSKNLFRWVSFTPEDYAIKPTDPFTQWINTIDDATVDLIDYTSDKKKKKKKKKGKKYIKSLQKNKEIASEPLAKLMEAQGHYEEAIKMYEELSLKKPEKSSFFAGKIEDLRKKL